MILYNRSLYSLCQILVPDPFLGLTSSMYYQIIIQRTYCCQAVSLWRWANAGPKWPRCSGWQQYSMVPRRCLQVQCSSGIVLSHIDKIVPTNDEYFHLRIPSCTALTRWGRRSRHRIVPTGAVYGVVGGLTFLACACAFDGFLL